MTYTPCPTFDGYIPLWLEFAGDPVLLDEIMDHRVSCPVCLANMSEARNSARVEPDPRDELLPVERRDIGAWLEVEAVRLGIVEVNSEI